MGKRHHQSRDILRYFHDLPALIADYRALLDITRKRLAALQAALESGPSQGVARLDGGTSAGVSDPTPAVAAGKSRERAETREELRRLTSEARDLSRSLHGMEHDAVILGIALRGLTTTQQEIVHLIYGQHRSHAEVAETMSLDRSSVSHQVGRARQALHRAMAHGGARLW